MKINEAGVLDKSVIFFHTPGSMSESVFYCIECIGHYFCDEKYYVSREKFSGYLLMNILSGRGFCETRGRRFEFSQGDVILLDSSLPHTYGASGKLEMQWMHFSGGSSGAYFKLLTEKTNLFSPTNFGFSNIFQELIAGFERGEPLPEPMASCDIQRLLAYLANPESPKNKEKQPVQNAVNYIEANYNHPITVDRLAQTANLSKYHFSRCFRQFAGFSPHEFITLTRINVAKHLLLRTDRPVKEIAFDSGFNSESHFVSTFRKQTGLTPNSFRRQNS